jgi:hypothetical protein
VANTLALYVILIVASAGIVFLSWVLVHLYLDGKRSKRTAVSVQRENHRGRMQPGGKAETPRRGQSEGAPSSSARKR